VTETEQPLEILCTELIPDVGGPGKHRGGMSIRRAYRLTEDEAVLQVRADRHTFRPYGLYGGTPGKPSRNRLISGGIERELTAKVTMTPMRRGDVFIHDQPGPGGWGDPLEREPARVLRDVLNELVSPESAREDYGVVIDAGAVDAGATARRRAELRAARGWTTPPAVSR
jgi:N-methylhydantoinase B